MPELDRRRFILIAGLALLGFAAIGFGWATFDQWSVFVGRLLAGLLG